MSRFPTFAAMCASAMVAFQSLQLAEGATKKSSATAKKKSTADSADTNAAPDGGDPATPAGKKASATPLDLPLPAKLPGVDTSSAPAEKKSAENPAPSAKPPPDKPGSDSAAKREHAPNATVEPDSI